MAKLVIQGGKASWMGEIENYSFRTLVYECLGPAGIDIDNCIPYAGSLCPWCQSSAVGVYEKVCIDYGVGPKCTFTVQPVCPQ